MRRGVSLFLTALGVAGIVAGLWWFNTVDVATHPCPQDMPIRCAPGTRVSPTPLGLWVALAGVAMVGLGVRRLSWDTGMTF